MTAPAGAGPGPCVAGGAALGWPAVRPLVPYRLPMPVTSIRRAAARTGAAETPTPPAIFVALDRFPIAPRVV